MAIIDTSMTDFEPFIYVFDKDSTKLIFENCIFDPTSNAVRIKWIFRAIFCQIAVQFFPFVE